MPDAQDLSSSPPDTPNHRVYAATYCFIAACLVVLIGVVVAFGQPSWMQSTVWLPMLFAIGASLPFVFVGIRLRTDAGTWAPGAAFGLGWFTIIASLSLTVFGFIFGILMLIGVGGIFPPIAVTADAANLLHDVMPGVGYMLIAFLFVDGILLQHQARAARRSVSPSSSTPHGWTRGWIVAFGYGVAGATLVYQLNRFELERRTRENNKPVLKVENRVNALNVTLRRVQSCALAYKSAYPKEGFPKSLHALDTAGVGCPDAATLSDDPTSGRLRYRPAPADRRGRIDGFSLVGKPNATGATKDLLYASEDGLVYWTTDSNDAASHFFADPTGDAALPMDPRMRSWVIGSPVKVLLDLRQCIIDFSPNSANRRYTHTIDGHPCTVGARVSLSGPLTIETSRDSTQYSAQYRLVYLPRQAAEDSGVVAFAIGARPNPYGAAGVRSYLMDEDGVIHWTLADRDATIDDPIVSECELKSTGCPVNGPRSEDQVH